MKHYTEIAGTGQAAAGQLPYARPHQQTGSGSKGVFSALYFVSGTPS